MLCAEPGRGEAKEDCRCKKDIEGEEGRGEKEEGCLAAALLRTAAEASLSIYRELL
jgi:hypothetical protein